MAKDTLMTVRTSRESLTEWKWLAEQRGTKLSKLVREYLNGELEKEHNEK